MRKKVKYYTITQGHIIAAWHLLYLSNCYKGIKTKDAIKITEKSGKLGGTVPADKGLRLCSDYGFLRFHKDELHVTELSESSLIPKCDNEELNVHAQRAILLHILSYHNFEWLIFYDTDQDIFRANVQDNDIEWASLLDNARLFDFEDEDVNIWWDRVLSKYEEYNEDVKKAIGDIGEKLTYQKELKRVKSDGFDSPKSCVKWASRISDRYGFDIQSIRGSQFMTSHNKAEKIQIEVKSTDANNVKSFRFFISKPEWNKALENINSYYFFCWSGINIENDTAQNGPYIIPATDMVNQVPTDNSEGCQWSECRCVMDISKYPII